MLLMSAHIGFTNVLNHDESFRRETSITTTAIELVIMSNSSSQAGYPVRISFGEIKLMNEHFVITFCKHFFCIIPKNSTKALCLQSFVANLKTKPQAKLFS